MMCTAVMTGLSIFSSVLGGIGQKQQYDAQAAAYKANAAVNEHNARLSEASAQDASDRGKVEEQKYRKDVAQVRGQQESALSASGLDLTAGSAADILSDTRVTEEEDAAWIRHNTEKEKWGFLNERQEHLRESERNKAAAKNAKKAGNMALFSSLASGAAMGAMEFGGSKTNSVGSASNNPFADIKDLSSKKVTTYRTNQQRVKSLLS